MAAIVAMPALVREARDALPALRTYATQKAGAAGVREVIGRRFALYPQPDRTPGEWTEWWADYHETLDDCSMAGLEAAMAVYVRSPDSEFMPKPGRLLELARTVENSPAGAYARARKAVDVAAAEQAERYRAPPTAEQSAAVRKMLADYEARFVRAPEDRVTRPDMPASHGKTDERGVTPELRAILARQQERDQ